MVNGAGTIGYNIFAKFHYPYPWLSGITPGECSDGSSQHVTAESFPVPASLSNLFRHDRGGLACAHTRDPHSARKRPRPVLETIPTTLFPTTPYRPQQTPWNAGSGSNEAIKTVFLRRIFGPLGYATTSHEGPFVFFPQPLASAGIDGDRKMRPDASTIITTFQPPPLISNCHHESISPDLGNRTDAQWQSSLLKPGKKIGFGCVEDTAMSKEKAYRNYKKLSLGLVSLVRTVKVVAAIVYRTKDIRFPKHVQDLLIKLRDLSSSASARSHRYTQCADNTARQLALRLAAMVHSMGVAMLTLSVPHFATSNAEKRSTYTVAWFESSENLFFRHRAGPPPETASQTRPLLKDAGFHTGAGSRTSLSANRLYPAGGTAVSWVASGRLTVRLLASHQHEPRSMPGQFTPDFRKWELCRTMPLVGGFSRGFPVSPALSFGCCSMPTSIALIGSHLAFKSRPNRFTHSPLQPFCPSGRAARAHYGPALGLTTVTLCPNLYRCGCHSDSSCLSCGDRPCHPVVVGGERIKIKTHRSPEPDANYNRKPVRFTNRLAAAGSLSDAGSTTDARTLFCYLGKLSKGCSRRLNIKQHVNMDVAAGRRVFSGISRSPPPLHSGAATYSPHFTLVGCKYLAAKRRNCVARNVPCWLDCRLASKYPGADWRTAFRRVGGQCVRLECVRNKRLFHLQGASSATCFPRKHSTKFTPKHVSSEPVTRLDDFDSHASQYRMWEIPYTVTSLRSWLDCKKKKNDWKSQLTICGLRHEKRVALKLTGFVRGTGLKPVHDKHGCFISSIIIIISQFNHEMMWPLRVRNSGRISIVFSR
ncbi:hypothetical protein PR048_028935 [Dryococelus australis]|uniref:Uncharacterized protein n=1 Tax=Dryococelus australis TaxID=614101 RepID=A0ABQ9GFM1_9NEOP|nr:hypothetical protein PR048_028935 [Dryococelus australis]